MEIDLNIVDNMALHHDYLVNQEMPHPFRCRPINSRWSRTIPIQFLEVRLYSIMDIDGDSHTEGASLMEYDPEILDDVRKPYVKHLLIQQ